MSISRQVSPRRWWDREPSPSRPLTPYSWYLRHQQVRRLFRITGPAAALVTVLFAVLGAGTVAALSLPVGLGDEWKVGLAIGLWLSGLLVLRLYLDSSQAFWFHARLTSWSFWEGRHPSRLPRWTLEDGAFPQARRFVSSQRLSFEEQECFEVLVGEFDGSLGELVALSRSVLSR